MACPWMYFGHRYFFGHWYSLIAWRMIDRWGVLIMAGSGFGWNYWIRCFRQSTPGSPRDLNSDL
jgi:hypothetical protein